MRHADMSTFWARPPRDKTIARLLSQLLLVSRLCVCVFTYCGITKQKTAEWGKRMRLQWEDRCGIEKVFVRALLCGAASRSQLCFLHMRGLSASHNNEHLCQTRLLSLHITVNDRRAARRISHLMSSRYVPVTKPEANLNICRSQLTSL